MVRLYRWLTWLCPAALRREYGAAMEETFARRLNDARASGFWTSARTCGREFSGLIGWLLSERWGAPAQLQWQRIQARRKRGRMESLTPETRAAWNRRTLERFWNDSRFAARLVRKHPASTLVTLTILALGIGATTTMFSVVNSVLLRPLPFREADRLVMLEERWLPRFPRFEATALDFLTWREECRSYRDIAAFRPGFFNLTEGDLSERVAGARVTANLPELLGVSPILGRSFTAEEGAPGKNQVVLLSHSLWQQQFGADQGVIGRVVRMNGLAFTVVGVMPPGFRFPSVADIWVPMGLTPEDLKSGDHVLWAVGRLKPGVTPRQALAELDVLMTRLYPDTWRGRVVSFDDYYVGDVRLALSVLFGAAACLLLIVCANVANLLLARGAARGREMAVRTSLGATRARIMQQLLTEGALLSLLGGGLGLAVAFGAGTLVRTWPWPGIYRLEETSLDLRALVFTMVSSIGTSVLFGLTPARRLSRPNLHDGLKAGGRAAGSRERTGIRSALVIAEVALAVVLLVGAGLFLRSLRRLLDVPLGFNPQHVLAVTINLPATVYHGPVQQVAFSERLLGRLNGLPGVEAAGISTSLPLVGVGDVGIRFDRRSPGSPLFATNANYYGVTPGYLRVMQVPLIRGRLFTEEDTATSLPVVLINETMARRSFPDEDPIGRRLDITGNTYMREIVGIVGDVKQESVKTATAPQVYEAFAQHPQTGFHVMLRAQGNPLVLTEAVRREVRAIDGAQPISKAQLMEDVVGRSMTRDRFSVLVLGAFACVALVLAAVGLYGVVAYVVTQRTNEIGVRMALGAEPRGIQRLVIVQSLQAVSIGVGIGLVGAVGMSSVLGSLLYEVKPLDPMTLAGVTILLVAVALTAAFIPARRAARVDPVLALRTE
jgi:putative ABC transport system permease protein